MARKKVVTVAVLAVVLTWSTVMAVLGYETAVAVVVPSSLAAWLAKRPTVEVVCRDRAPFFAEGATAGAPQAVQVADRWHLWRNLNEAAERCVADQRGCLQVLASDPAQTAPELEKFEDPSGSP
jgi:hypothetical protein